MVTEISSYLQQRLQVCLEAGISADRIILDPGFGFGKSLRHNLELLRNLEGFAGLGYPLLVGVSRKSMIGQLLDDRSVGQRLSGSLAAAVVAAMKGASILRVHDVRETVDAMRVVTAMNRQ